MLWSDQWNISEVVASEVVTNNVFHIYKADPWRVNSLWSSDAIWHSGHSQHSFMVLNVTWRQQAMTVITVDVWSTKALIIYLVKIWIKIWSFWFKKIHFDISPIQLWPSFSAPNILSNYNCKGWPQILPLLHTKDFHIKHYQAQT